MLGMSNSYIPSLKYKKIHVPTSINPLFRTGGACCFTGTYLVVTHVLAHRRLFQTGKPVVLQAFRFTFPTTFLITFPIVTL